ncbi:MAG: YceI family protein [Candidatus Dormibacteraeota bacterium]|nr:YceI family protein [Candidatus Dormibacteraeota bacterium]
MSRTARAAIATGVVALVIAAVAGGAYFLTSPHQSAGRFALSPSPRPPTTSGDAGLQGTWVVDAGSQAGYRVSERFVGQAADSEAVARTATISGQMVLGGSGTELRLQSATFSADISKLKSEDANATHGSAIRDIFVARTYLETAVYPMATFVAGPQALASAGSPASLSIAGTFATHGVTHDLTIPLQVTRSAERLEVVGSFPLHYSDYKVDVPQVPFTSASPDATIEVHLFLKRQT